MKVERLWDVEGVPVAEVRDESGLRVLALDGEAPRPFALASAYRNGAPLEADRFDARFPEARKLLSKAGP